MTISKSPDRHTFQKEGYVKRCEEEGKLPNPDYIEMYKTWREQDQANLEDPAWQKDNMEYDLRSTEWILAKARASEDYAQNIYAALCNNGFTKLDVIPILTGQEWSCSWRHAGGIIADMREQGDYIDWYCSGIKGGHDMGGGTDTSPPGYVPEGFITAEIREDFKRLGWVPAKGGDWENFTD